MKTRNLRAILVMLVLAAMVVAGGWYVFRQSDHNLTHIGRRVADLRLSKTLDTLYTIGSHKDNRVLACRWDEARRHYVEIDMHSGANTSLTKLDSVIRHGPDTKLGELSPDGQWLMYHWALDEMVPIFDYAVRVDGSQLVRWKNDVHEGPSESIWSADSQGGININSYTGRISRWRLSDPVLRPVTTAHSSVKRLEDGFIAIGPVAGGYLGYIEEPPAMRATDPPPRFLYVIHVDEEGRQQPIGTVKVPHGGRYIRLELSPNQRKLLLVTHYDIKPSPNSWLRKLNAWLHKETGSFDSLWTCDVNGSNLREVGYVRSKDFSDLRAGWIREQDNLWFEFGGSLWTVSAGS